MFSSYSSIENHYRKSEVDNIKLYLSGLREVEPEVEPPVFVCTEKVHGSNFQIYIFEDDDKSITIKLGKRKSMITPDVKFFPLAIEQVMKAYRKISIDLFLNVKKEYPDMNLLILYGELYGGFYPDGTKLVHKPIQKHLYYCQHFDFYPFDIKVVTVEQVGEVHNKRGKFIGYDSFEKYIEEAGWKIYGRKIFEGSFSECLEFDTRFSSKVAQWHNMPPRKDNDENICEGVVIKPLGKPLYIGNERIIIKKKNEEFSEVQKPRKEKKEKKKGDDFTEDERKVYNQLLDYINLNRFESVVSKEGEVNIKMFGKLMKLFSIDVLEEFEKDVNWKEIIDEKSRKKVRKRMNGALAKVIKEWFLLNE